MEHEFNNPNLILNPNDVETYNPDLARIDFPVKWNQKTKTKFDEEGKLFSTLY